MRIVVVTSDGPGNGAIASAIARAHSDVRVFVETQPALEPARRVLRRRGDPWHRRIDRLAFFAWYTICHAPALHQAVVAALGDDSLPAGARRCAGAPDNALLDEIRADAPHALVVLGASPLPPAWCAAATVVLNVHTGWMPEYRGRFCWYWPVVEGDTGHVGVTVHRLAERLDAGEILWRSRIETLPRTLEQLLTAVLVLARAGVLEVLGRLDRGELLEGLAAAPLGPIRFEPGLRDHVCFVRRLRSGRQE